MEWQRGKIGTRLTKVLLSQGKDPKNYWGEAILTFAYIITRLPSQILENKSPLETLKNFFPHFKI